MSNTGRSPEAKKRRNKKSKAKYKGITKALKANLHREQNGECHWCGGAMLLGGEVETQPRTTTVEHLIPLARGGTNKKDNLVAACRRCNDLRGNSLTNPINPTPTPTHDKRRPS